MRICKVCAQEKRYDPSMPTHSKASGFHSTSCWDCYLKAQRARTAGPAKFVTSYLVQEALQAVLKTTSSKSETATCISQSVLKAQAKALVLQEAQHKLTAAQKTRTKLKELRDAVRDLDSELSSRMRLAKKRLDKLPFGELELEREKAWNVLKEYEMQLQNARE